MTGDASPTSDGWSVCVAGLQEYVEALSFYHYLLNDGVISCAEVQQRLTYPRTAAATLPETAAETGPAEPPPPADSDSTEVCVQSPLTDRAQPQCAHPPGMFGNVSSPFPPFFHFNHFLRQTRAVSRLVSCRFTAQIALPSRVTRSQPRAGC